MALRTESRPDSDADQQGNRANGQSQPVGSSDQSARLSRLGGQTPLDTAGAARPAASPVGGGSRPATGSSDQSSRLRDGFGGSFQKPLGSNIGMPSMRPSGQTQDSAAPGGIKIGNPAEKTSKGGLSAGALGDAEAKASGANGAGGATATAGKAKGAAEDAAAVASGNPLGIAKTALKFLGRRKKKYGAIGGILGGLVIVVIILLNVFILPFKTLSLMNNIRSIFGANVDKATSDMVVNLENHYIAKYLIPGMVTNKCSSTYRDKSCAAIAKGDSLPERLFNTWHDTNIEKKWATAPDPNNFEIRKVGNHFYMRSSSLNGDLDMGVYDAAHTREFDGQLFAKLNNTDVRETVRLALENESFGKEVRDRFTVEKWMDRRFGIRWCIRTCDTRDKLDDKWATAKANVKGRIARITISNRVLLPYTDNLGLALECAIQGFECSKLNAPNQDNEVTTRYQDDLKVRVDAYRTQYGEQAVKELDENALEINKKGFVVYLIERYLGKTAAKAATIAADVSNPAGWAIAAATANVLVTKAGPTLAMMAYQMNKAGAVQLYGVYLSSAQELQTGDSDAATAKSFADTLDRNPQTDQGGGAAEDSPSYNVIMSDSNAGSLASSVLGNASHGVTASNTIARCNDGAKYPAGALVCPETSAAAGSDIAKLATKVSLASDITNKATSIVLPGGLNPGTISTIIVDLSNIISAGFSTLISYVPGVAIVNAAINQFIADHLGAYLAYVQNAVIKTLFVIPFTANMSGSRIVELLFAGADHALNDVARYRIGGYLLSPGQKAAINEKTAADHQYAFDQLPIKDKLFSKTDSYSVVSQLATIMPASSGTLASRFSSTVSGLWQVSATSLASVVGPKKAHAFRVVPDLWGISQYGWALDNPIFKADPVDGDSATKVKGWKDAGCDTPATTMTATQSAEYYIYQNYLKGNDATSLLVSNGTPVSGIPETTVGDPCKLWKSSVSMAGCVFNTALCDSTPDMSTAGCPQDGDVAVTYPSLKLELEKPPTNLGGGQGVLQDPVSCDWYFIQAIGDPGNQDFRVVRYDSTGKYMSGSEMFMKDGGHALVAGLEHNNSDNATYIWVSYGYEDGPGTGGLHKGTMTRIKYMPGNFTESSPNVQKIDIFKNYNAYVSIDQANDLIAFRYGDGNSDTDIYRFSDLIAGKKTKLGDANGAPDIGVLQGFAIGGDTVYYLQGTANLSTHLVAYNWVTHKKTYDNDDLSKLAYEGSSCKGDYEPETIQAQSDGIVFSFKTYPTNCPDKIRAFRVLPPAVSLAP